MNTTNTSGLGSARLGAGSPLHDSNTRLFPKRTRELQAQEGLSPSIWGPPTASGNSTPLRENIPESPTRDGFPDLVAPADAGLNSPARRARAGTVPSRLSPAGNLNGMNFQQSLLSKTSRPTPSTSPFKPQITSAPEPASSLLAASSTNAALLSRLRAGSMPQKSNFLGSSSPFGNSLFSTNWGPSRERTTTLTSIKAQEDPSSPAQSTFSKDGLTDSDVKTLDYLGLVETPQQPRAALARPINNEGMAQQHTLGLPQLLDYNMLTRNVNRFRSYSVNAAGKYEDEDEYGVPYSALPSGTLTPSAAALDAQLAATQAQIHQHNLAVQAFANHASANRPRARTTGILDTPPQRASLRNYLVQPSRLESSVNAADLPLEESGDYEKLAESVRLLQMNGVSAECLQNKVDDDGTVASRSLWIGSIPNSTTVSSLDAIFSIYGPIESTRVLTHKNCGFVNFHNVTNAIQAKQLLNGKEIFPGAGPVRIGYAKAPSSTGTPGNGTVQQSPTADPHSDTLPSNLASHEREGSGADTVHVKTSAAAMQIPKLAELRSEMMNIVVEFGAADGTSAKIANNIDSAIAYGCYETEIPPTPEPSHTRMFDAPRLRDIRKRIDNRVCSHTEIEETAAQMLPEITELASDYLGNTVVQKMFEYCSEELKEQMLAQLAPHLAEIGVHKNGTWAAQKIIDVCKTVPQMTMIVDRLRPYTVPLFLDQYGNYVVQCCLRFGPPFNDFIFETMLSRMWEIAQGRFGARAMRACLESHHATKEQQRMLASAIALHSVQLATNTNGALLLTWFLDTSTFPRRRTVLAPRLVPHLVHLCTHKVAYLTVLKVINQRNEPEARETVLRALFFSTDDVVLERILSDQSSGATLIFKVLTTPFFDENIRSEVVKNVSKVLTKIKAQPNQGYKRLMDEVGMSSRSGAQMQGHAHPASHDRQRPIAQQGNIGLMPQPTLERQFSNQYVPNMNVAPFEAGQGLPRSGSADSINFSPYNFNMSGPPQSNYPAQTPVQQLAPQQLQYQAFYAGPQRNNNSFMQSGPPNGFAGYATPPPSIDTMNYRAASQSHGSPLTGPAQMGSPMMNAGGGFGQQSYSPVMGGNMYGYPQQGHLSHQQMQPVHGGSGNRRGRVRCPLRFLSCRFTDQMLQR
jgi:protein JSN1